MHISLQHHTIIFTTVMVGISLMLLLKLESTNSDAISVNIFTDSLICFRVSPKILNVQYKTVSRCAGDS